jgi:hypothetical protein
LARSVAEDLLARPANGWVAAQQAAAADPAQAAVYRIDLIHAALLAGEPKRAQQLIAELAAEPESTAFGRHLAALSYWAQQLDTNWYPGGIGSEIVELPMINITPTPEASWTALVEMLVTHGPVALLTRRTVMAQLLDRGLPSAAAELADDTIAMLQQLIDFSNAVEQTAVAFWAAIAQAGIEHQVGHSKPPNNGSPLFGRTRPNETWARRRR